jgi:hypothetical protein
MVKLFSKACVAYDLKSGQYVRKDFSAVELSDEQDNIYLILNPEDNTKDNYRHLAIIFTNSTAYSYAIENTLVKVKHEFKLKFKLTNARYINDEKGLYKWKVLETSPSPEVEITDDQFRQIYRKTEADLESYLVEDPIKILNECVETGQTDKKISKEFGDNGQTDSERSLVEEPITILNACGGTGRAVLETLTRLKKGTQNQTGFYGFFKWIYWYGAQDKHTKIMNAISELKPKNEPALQEALNSGDLFQTINAKRHGFAFNLHRYFFYKNTSKSMAKVQSSLNFK